MKSEVERRLKVLEVRFSEHTSIDQSSRLTQLAIASNITDSLPVTEPKRAQNAAEHSDLSHIVWMLSQVRQNYDSWNLGKLGRWVGTALGCVVANGYIDLEDVQQIVANAKIAHGESVDEELKQHQDPNDPFQIEIGGGD